MARVKTITPKPRAIALTFAKAAGAGLREDAEAVYGDFDALEVTREWRANAVAPTSSWTPS